jgi:GxxExxY protein
MSEFLYKKESYMIRGACFEVYKEKGNGFLEQVYQECLGKELTRQSIPFSEQTPIKLFYKGDPLKQGYIPDFICYDKIILEIKAVKKLTDEHRSQLLNYLKATGHKLGFLVNFGHHPGIEIERVALSKNSSV